MGPRRLGIVAIVAGCFAVDVALAEVVPAVEYYHAEFDHYFMTASPSEIAYLDGGAFGGVWKRTGESFLVNSQPAGDAFPTCRFYSTAFGPRSSHFYTPFDFECEYVKANPKWQYEEIAFYLRVPDASGACAAGTVVLRRFFNGGMGGAPNHRYTTSPVIFAEMQARGWTPEGSPATGAFACAESPGLASATGVWSGTTSAQQLVRAVILEDGSYYIFYTQPASLEEGGVFQGTSTAVGGTLTSADGRDYAIGTSIPKAPAAVTLTGTYVPHGTLQLTVAPSGLTITATYDASFEKPASVAPMIGNYVGWSGHSTGSALRETSFSVSADGSVAGANPLCNFTGLATPHPTLDVFRWTLTGQSAACVFGTSPVSGLMYYDAANRRIGAVAPFENRADLYFVLGSK